MGVGQPSMTGSRYEFGSVSRRGAKVRPKRHPVRTGLAGHDKSWLRTMIVANRAVGMAVSLTRS